MRIAQVSTLYESVPPRAYGGIERVVSYLTEGLVSLGHDVTLFASADSKTRARLVPESDVPLREIEDTADPQALHFAMLEDVVRRSGKFDIVHFHVDYLHFPFSARLACPHVTTLHWRLDVPGLAELYAQFPEVPLVSISDAQRAPLAALNWQATVYHGLPERLYAYSPEPDNHVAFLGRIAPAKRPDLAIEIARRAGLPLEIAAKVDNGDRWYYEKEIEPLLSDAQVRFVGEVADEEKGSFLGRARALLFPVDWPEPFGLVMAEALACGTPVIAFRRGAVAEVIEHGVTGFVVDNVDEAVDALARIDTISRRACRDAFERRFSAARMTREYVDVYERVLSHATRR
jgi:glycosyltransferase involved in cell wall biosynthesis